MTNKRKVTRRPRNAPTPAPALSIQEEFEGFIGKLSVKQPHLSDDEIVQKIVAWIESKSTNHQVQLSILKKINLFLHPDKIEADGTVLASYLRDALSGDHRVDFYFIQLRASFEPISENNAATLSAFYVFLESARTSAAAAAHLTYTPSILYKQVSLWINTTATTPQAKRLLARQIVRYFGASDKVLLCFFENLCGMT